jgi:hypothetical protein
MGMKREPTLGVLETIATHASKEAKNNAPGFL